MGRMKLNGGDVMLRDGHWMIKEYIGDTTGYGEACISHECSVRTESGSIELNREGYPRETQHWCCCTQIKCCPNCGQEIPDKLVGMKKLIEWET
jgi:hypothetical protein